MAKKQNKATQDQKKMRDVFTQITSSLMIINNLANDDNAINLDVSPFSYLITLCQKLGIYDEIIDWLCKYLIYSLPVIELGVKGILLANLKARIDCSTDPFIPDKFRLSSKHIPNTEVTNEQFNFYLNSIDYHNLLDYCPLSPASEYKYLGLENEYYLESRAHKNNITGLNFNNSNIQGETINNIVMPNGLIGPYESYMDATEALITINASTDAYSITKDQRFNTIYKLAKATDFNAFLWLVINKGNSINSNIITGTSNTLITQDLKNYFTQTRNQQSTTTHGLHYNIVEPKVPQEGEESSAITAGETFIIKSGENLLPALLMCIQNKFKGENVGWGNEKYRISESFITQISQDMNSINWYGNRSTYYNFLIPKKDAKIKRDFDNDIGICNVRYYNKENKIGISILPKPFIIKPNIEKGRILPIIVRLNSQGLIDNNGRYSVRANEKIEGSSKIKTTNEFSILEGFIRCGLWNYISPSLSNDLRVYTNVVDYFLVNCANFSTQKSLFNAIDAKKIALEHANVNPSLYWEHGNYNEANLAKFCQERNIVISFTEEGEKYISLLKKQGENNDSYPLLTITNQVCGYLVVSNIDSSIHFTDQNGTTVNFPPKECIYECYPNLTIYEFNYDFIMSQTLFDPKVVANQIIENLLGVRGNINIQRNRIEGSEDTLIREIIDDIITANTYEKSDCFFNFDNSEYDKLHDIAEEKRQKGEKIESDYGEINKDDIDKINDILNEFDDNATQEKKIYVLNKAFEQAITTLEKGTEDDLSVRYNIFEKIIRAIVLEIIRALITPKILILFEINKQLLGDYSEYLSARDFLKAIKDIIINIIKKIKDLIIREIMNLILSILEEICERLMQMLVLEQYEYYRDLILKLIKECRFSFGKGRYDDTRTDYVDYADIDIPDIKPKDEKC